MPDPTETPTPESEAAETVATETPVVPETPPAPAGPSLEEIVARMEASNSDVVRAINARPAAPVAAPVVEVDPYKGVDPQTLSGADFDNYVAHRAGRIARDQVAKETAELRKQLEQVNGYIAHQNRSEAQKQFDEVRSKNPAEFDKLLPAIKAKYEQHPTLGLKDLYTLAKAEQPGVNPPAAVTQPPRVARGSERPTHSAARPPAKVTRETPLPQGFRPGLRQLIAEGVAAIKVQS